MALGTFLSLWEEKINGSKECRARFTDVKVRNNDVSVECPQAEYLSYLLFYLLRFNLKTLSTTNYYIASGTFISRDKYNRYEKACELYLHSLTV
jgi:hypothetical protein